VDEGRWHGQILLRALQGKSDSVQNDDDEDGFHAESTNSGNATALRRRRRQKSGGKGGQWTSKQDGDAHAAHPLEASANARKAKPTPTPLWPEEIRCAELSAELKAGGEQMTSALAALKDKVFSMSCESAGCRVVQDALALVDIRTAESLTAELHGNVQNAINSPHGNYVIQKMVSCLPFSVARFAVEELRGYAAGTMRHRFGCRILCRLMENAGKEEETGTLVDEALEQAEDLCRHSFGHYVIESILKHTGFTRHKAQIASALYQDLLRNAKNKNASYVIEQAITHCSEQDSQALFSALVAEIPKLAQNQFGLFVVLSLLRQPGERGQAALEALKNSVDRHTFHQITEKHQKWLAEHRASAVSVAA